MKMFIISKVSILLNCSWPRTASTNSLLVTCHVIYLHRHLYDTKMILKHFDTCPSLLTSISAKALSAMCSLLT